MKYFISFSLGIPSLSSLIAAHGAEDFAEAQAILKLKIACEKLSTEQLEILGTYFMEQLHPRQFHGLIEVRLGGDESEPVRQVHIELGKVFYCGEKGVMHEEVMAMVSGRNTSLFSERGGREHEGISTLMTIFLLLALLFAVTTVILLLRNRRKTR